MVMTVDFLTYFRDKSANLLIKALEKKGLTINVINSFNDINNNSFLIIWDSTLIPSRIKYINSIHNTTKDLTTKDLTTKDLDLTSRTLGIIKFKNFNWIKLEQWRYLYHIQTHFGNNVYPLLIIQESCWVQIIKNFSKNLYKENYVQYLIIPSFIGYNDTKYPYQIMNIKNNEIDLKVSSDDGFLLVYPWSDKIQKLFSNKGLISVIFINGIYHSAYKKKVDKITDLVNETFRCKIKASSFMIRLAKMVINSFKYTLFDSSDPVIQIDFYPSDKIIDKWIIGQIHTLTHDNFININPKLANKWSSSIAKEFSEYKEKRKKFLGLC